MISYDRSRMGPSPSNLTDQAQAREALTAVRHFNGLPEVVQNSLPAAAVMRRFHPGQIIYDVAIFNEIPYPGTVTALEPVEAWSIEKRKCWPCSTGSNTRIE